MAPPWAYFWKASRQKGERSRVVDAHMCPDNSRRADKRYDEAFSKFAVQRTHFEKAANS
jgi:hypothetical protein